MRKVIDAIAALLVATSIWLVHARAQEPVYPGTYTAGANGNGLSFAPYSASNPLPVTLEGSGGTSNVNVLQWGTTTLGAPVAWGSVPSGNVIGANVNVVAGSVTTTPPVLSTVACTALCANQVVKASAGSLYSFNVSADSTLSAAAWWIMVYNATSAPGDGAVTPAKCYAMASGTTSFSAAFPNPVPLSTGIVIGVSTNGCFTKAASTHAFISGDYQ